MIPSCRAIDEWTGETYEIRLSPVYFDRHHTLALVLMSNFRGSLCGARLQNRLLTTGDRATRIQPAKGISC